MVGTTWYCLNYMNLLRSIQREGSPPPESQYILRFLTIYHLIYFHLGVMCTKPHPEPTTYLPHANGTSGDYLRGRHRRASLFSLRVGVVAGSLAGLECWRKGHE